MILHTRAKRVNPLVLDRVQGTTAAYSLRKLRSAYTGACINIRRSSDNATQDIGFDSNGNLDTGSIYRFIGVNSAFVTIWYDQSGRGLNASQSTSANQSRIVNAGIIDSQNNKGSLFFNGTSNSFNLNLSMMNNVAGFSAITVINPTTSATQSTIIYFSNGANASQSRFNIFKNTLNNLSFQGRRLDADTVQTITGSGTISNVLVTSKAIVDYLGTSAKLFINTNQQASSSSYQTSGNSSATNSLSSSIGSMNGSNFFSGYISEIIIFSSALSDLVHRNMELNQKSYYGTP